MCCVKGVLRDTPPPVPLRMKGEGLERRERWRSEAACLLLFCFTLVFACLLGVLSFGLIFDFPFGGVAGVREGYWETGR